MKLGYHHITLFFLVWSIYIKPLPVCLLNYDFWAAYLRLPGERKADSTIVSSNAVIPNFDRSAAVGFLRSYAFLIKHRIGFILAKDSRLVPEDVDWIEWSKFINNFRKLEDHHVAKRYHYGQLRLSR